MRREETSTACQSFLRSAEDGSRQRGRLGGQTGQRSIFAGDASVDAGHRAGRAAGAEHRAAHGRNWDVCCPGSQQHSSGEAVFVSR